PGVRSVAVSLESNRAAVRWDSNAPANIQALVRAVKEAGYAAQVHSRPRPSSSSSTQGRKIENEEEGRGRVGSWRFNVMVGLAGTVPLLLGEWVFHLGMARWFQWLSFTLASLVQ